MINQMRGECITKEDCNSPRCHSSLDRDKAHAEEERDSANQTPTDAKLGDIPLTRSASALSIISNKVSSIDDDKLSFYLLRRVLRDSAYLKPHVVLVL